MSIHKFDKEDKKEEIRKIATQLRKTPTIQDVKKSKTNISLHKIVYFYAGS